MAKSFFRRLLGSKDADKSTPETENSPQESVSEKEDLFGAITELAGQSLQHVPPVSNRSSDLSLLSPDDFEQPQILAESDAKIEELNAIIRYIENRPAFEHNVKFQQQYKINYAALLNPAQLAAVVSTEGPVLVIAGAGSGKTRVIVYRVAYMLENGIAPQEILLLTFTRRAASEMIGRVQELLHDNNAQKILGGTFHSFANYVLRRYANLLNITSNFSIIDSEDSADTIDLIKSELKISGNDRAFPKKHRIQEIISSARNRNLSIGDVINHEFTGLIEYIGHIETIAAAYEQYKKAAALFDYDDLMDVLRDSLRYNEYFRMSLQRDYRYIMADEYQDTNVVQREIIELIAGEHRNILVVGDDAQSIYSFRGANYENILRFPQVYPDCRLIKIEENYRSNQKILDFTNDIIRNARIGYKKKLYSSIVRDGLPLVRKFFDQQGEADFIVSKILEYREKGISLNQIAILVRAFWHARYIEIELNRRGIPYVAVGGLAFNERKHVKDIISYLRITQNPYDAVAWHRILKYLPGVGQVTARKIIQKVIAEKRLNIETFESSRFSEGLKELIQMLDKASKPELSVSQKVSLISIYYEPILKATEHDYQVRLLDIAVLSDLAGRYESLTRFLTDFALDPPSKKFGTKTTPLIDETEDKPLTISTIHSAKGLEWYSVVIPHALDGLLPSSRALKNIEELEEERRLFYVACSRAKQELIITMPSFVATYNGFLSYPSRFLAEISRDKYLLI